MRYTLLIYLDPKAFSALSADEQNRVHRDCGAWHDELVRTGRSRSATALQPNETPVTLRGGEGRVAVTDGPFIETKEVLGGYENIVCGDRDEAVAIARRFPGLLAGCSIEIRAEILGNKCEA